MQIFFSKEGILSYYSHEEISLAHLAVIFVYVISEMVVCCNIVDFGV